MTTEHRFKQDDPVIRRIVRTRYIGALVCTITLIIAVQLRIFLGIGEYAVLIPAVGMLLFLLDAFLIKGRVHAGYFGDNRMECEQVARAVTELQAEQNAQRNEER